MNNKHKTHGGASMGRASDPNSAEIALPVNAFPVQSGLKEKEKKNDCLAAVLKINISISILAPKHKQTHTSASVFGGDRFGLIRGWASALRHVPLGQRITTSGLSSSLMSPAVGGTAERPASEGSHLKGGNPERLEGGASS